MWLKVKIFSYFEYKIGFRLNFLSWADQALLKVMDRPHHDHIGLHDRWFDMRIITMRLLFCVAFFFAFIRIVQAVIRIVRSDRIDVIEKLPAFFVLSFVCFDNLITVLFRHYRRYYTWSCWIQAMIPTLSATWVLCVFLCSPSRHGSGSVMATTSHKPFSIHFFSYC